MKIRIQDSSVRFRISLSELEQINSEGRLEKITIAPPPAEGESEGRFVYGVEASGEGSESICRVKPGSIILHLSPADMKTLNDPSLEGVYIKREFKLASGETHRSLAFIEKDRPATKCDKPEVWIYEDPPNAERTTRPIEKK